MDWIFMAKEALIVLTIRLEASQHSKDREKAMIAIPFKLSLLLFLFTILAIYLLNSSNDGALGAMIVFDLFFIRLIAVIQEHIICLLDFFRS